MLSYQNQHVEQFYDPQEAYYHTVEVDQQANLHLQSNLQIDGKLIIQQTPDYTCYIDSSPSPQQQNQFNHTQYGYNNCNQNQNNHSLSTAADPSTDENNQHQIGQVESSDHNGYDYNQVQQHHYIGHQHQQQINQCRASSGSRVAHLEPMPNQAIEQATALNSPVLRSPQKLRPQESHKIHHHHHQQQHQHQHQHQHQNQNHLIQTATNRQEPNNLVASHETDPTRAYGTRLQANEQQVDNLYSSSNNNNNNNNHSNNSSRSTNNNNNRSNNNDNNCDSVAYQQEQQVEQFYEPQESYYQTMEAEHANNLHYSNNIPVHNKLLIQQTNEYSCYMDAEKTAQHQGQFNQTQYGYNNCDHNQNNLVLSTSASPTSAASVCLSSIGSSASPVDSSYVTPNTDNLRAQLQSEPIILEHYQPQNAALGAESSTGCDVMPATGGILSMHSLIEENQPSDRCLVSQQQKQQQQQQHQQQQQQHQQQQQVKKQIYRSSPIHLWEFLKELLQQVDTGCADANVIRWLDRQKGVFKIEDSVRVAKLWGKRKNKPKMNYDKLSRSIRQYYKKGIMKKTDRSQRLVYQFCSAYCH